MSDTIITNVDVVSGPKDTSSIVVQQRTPSLWTPGGMEKAENDLCIHTMDALMRAYPGYNWHVTSDLFQGVVMFRIYDLMGHSLAGVINLGQYPDVPSSIVRKLAGEMLERMGLPRGAVTKAEIQEAKTRLHTFQFDDVGKKRA
jgi:hypothetical protein